MKNYFLLLLVLSLSGCSTKQYYDSIKEANIQISKDNDSIAQSCSDGLQHATDEGTRLAIALTTCQKTIPLLVAAPPDRASDILRALFPFLFAIPSYVDGGGPNEAWRDYRESGTMKAGRDIKIYKEETTHESISSD